MNPRQVLLLICLPAFIYSESLYANSSHSPSPSVKISSSSDAYYYKFIRLYAPRRIYCSFISKALVDLPIEKKAYVEELISNFEYILYLRKSASKEIIAQYQNFEPDRLDALNRIKEALGRDKFSAFSTFIEMRQQRKAIDAYNTALAYRGIPLSSHQIESLVKILYENRVDSIQSTATQIEIEVDSQKRADARSAILDQAKSVLTKVQFNELEVELDIDKAYYEFVYTKFSGH